MVVRGKDDTAARAWDALHIAAIADATLRRHRTDQPCRWHFHDGVARSAHPRGQARIRIIKQRT